MFRFQTLAVLTATALSAACASQPVDKTTPGQTGSSIALLRGNTRLAVVDPDQGSVSVVDTATMKSVGSVDVGGEPHQLVVDGDDVLVATYRGGEVVRVNTQTMSVTGRLKVCAGPWGIAMAPAGWLAVGCEWEGTVRKVSAQFSSNEVVGQVWRARAVAVQGDVIRAATFAGPDARVWSFGPGVLDAVQPLPQSNVGSGNGGFAGNVAEPVTSEDAFALQSKTVTQISALLPMPDGGLLVAAQAVANQQDSAPGAGGYGDVSASGPRVNPVVVRLDGNNRVAGPSTYARFDATGRGFNAPSALALTGLDGVLVAHLSSNDVAELDLRQTTPDARLMARTPTAFGARGIAVDAAADVAYVDCAFDNAITRMPLHQVTAADDVAQNFARELPQPFSESARLGRRQFHNAANAHMTPLGVVACSTCHPDGGDDGLTWFLGAGKVTPRIRRSMHLGTAPIGRAGLHWDAEFADMASVMASTVANLMGGDAEGLDGAAFGAYVTEIVRVPEPPAGDPSAIVRGRVIFESTAGCAACHSGPHLTDDQPHEAFATMATTAGDTLVKARTPSLRGVFLRAPYFHDGRAATLSDLANRTDLKEHPNPGKLSAGDQADLFAYLKSL